MSCASVLSHAARVVQYRPSDTDNLKRSAEVTNRPTAAHRRGHARAPTPTQRRALLCYTRQPPPTRAPRFTRKNLRGTGGGGGRGAHGRARTGTDGHDRDSQIDRELPRERDERLRGGRHRRRPVSRNALTPTPLARRSRTTSSSPNTLALCVRRRRCVAHLAHLLPSTSRCV